MLAYVERAPRELQLGPRVALTATRIWTSEMRVEHCPLLSLRVLFGQLGVFGALWPAHNFFYWMQAHAARPISLGCPCCGRVSDDEALLLAAIFAATPAPARASLADMTMPAAADGAARLAMALGRELAAHRFNPVHGNAP